MSIFNYPRYPDWTSRWAYFIQDCLHLRTDLKVDWEHINCTQFSGQGIAAITGHDPYEEGGWEGKFSTPEEAADTIKAAGFSSLDELIASLFKEVPLSMAWPGDVVLIKAAPQMDLSVGVVKMMPHGVVLADPPFFYAVTHEGLGRGDLYGDAVRAFAVGREI